MGLTGERPLDGRVALVTGASRGIGRALALALAGAGAAVACAARSRDLVESTAREIRAAGGVADAVLMDVTRSDEVGAGVAAAERALGPLDILVNNAGITLERRTIELSDEEWDRVLATNLTAMFRCARAAGASMIPRGRGVIVNIGSMWGRVGVPRYTAYCVSKAGVEALTRCLAVEWARHGIRVNCLAPGYVETDFSTEKLLDPRMRERILGKIPERRIAAAAEIGPLAVYLASDDSAFMTGQTVVIDGGQTAALPDLEPVR